MLALLCSLIAMVSVAALKSSNQNLFQKRDHKLSFVGEEVDKSNEGLLNMLVNENKSTEEMFAAMGIEKIKEDVAKYDPPLNHSHHRVLPKLKTLENDLLHHKDFSKDPNATAVMDALGMTEDEKQEMLHTARIDTPVDIAIQTCQEDSHKLGCKDSVSPIHCLALAVKETAAEISLQCRKKTEKALRYACSVELYTTHCDGVEMPLVQCLDKNHPSLGEECKDTLTVTKKVMKSLKGMKHTEQESLEDMTRELGQESSGLGNMSFGIILVLVVLAALLVRFQKTDLLTTLQDLAHREAAAIRIPGFAAPVRPSKFEEFGMDDEEPLLQSKEPITDFLDEACEMSRLGRPADEEL